MINKNTNKIEIVKVENGGFVIGNYGDFEYIADDLDEVFEILNKVWK
mgnify:CR=1 FL=1